MTRLIADIGGTNARFALSDGPGEVRDPRVLKVAEHDGPADAAEAYLDGRTVEEAAFAVALPVAGDFVRLTNAPWAFSIKATRAALGLKRLAVINDFVAQGLAVTQLGEADMEVVCPGEEVRDAAKAVLGPGTGLGVGALVPTPRGWRAVPSEGGHVAFAPLDDEEAALLEVVRRRFGRVSVERLVSGPGLVTLAEAYATLNGRDLGDPLTPDHVTARAADRSCPDCAAAVARFVLILGSFAGDVALTFCAQGGVYLAGGIPPRLGPLFDREAFRARFVAKGRFEDYLGAMPVRLVRGREPGLLGASAYRFEA